MNPGLLLPQMKTLVLPVRPEGAVVPEFDPVCIPQLRQDDDCLGRMAGVMRRVGEAQDSLHSTEYLELYAVLGTKLQECLDLARALEKSAYTAVHAQASNMLKSLDIHRMDILEIDQCVARFGELLHYETRRIRYLQYSVSFTTGQACILFEGNFVDDKGVEHRNVPIEVRLTPDSVVRVLARKPTADC